MRIALLAAVVAGCAHTAAPPAPPPPAPREAPPPPPPPDTSPAPVRGEPPHDAGRFSPDIVAPAPPPAGRLVVGIPSGTSSMDGAIIRRIIRTHHGLALRCYQLQRDRDPTSAGTVAVHLEFGPDGVVTSATASGVARGLEECLGKALPAIRFPQSVGTSRIDISLTFSPP